MPPPFQGGGFVCDEITNQYPTPLSMEVKARGSFGGGGGVGILRDDQPPASLHLRRAEAFKLDLPSPRPVAC
jgi:hypothetical protein